MNKIITSTIVIILFIALIPVILLASSDMNIRNRALNETNALLYSRDSVQYGYDNETKSYLKSHPELKLHQMSDLQGSDESGSYFTGKTENNTILKIYVNFSANQNRLEDYNPVLHIEKIKLMNYRA
ncbi:hypothetical protein M5C72_00805 [Companilactobacillus allii]|uniref:DUF1310 domain-containing protein n=1 Tax=Companilactobacillus allii TaxID=1847728 RepID=A0A1P8Q1H6_9LACO|nr:hypothetical protein [Companilactobacillus allii]APX71718.1 hypothetical protein BTM29_03735 [Companilactobacillus allii]USQ68806.1 hypothetical protein M5C72_00805 [Companilactobacillus allii]